MSNSPAELKLVWAWERSTWMTAAVVGRKQTSVTVSQCVQGVSNWALFISVALCTGFYQISYVSETFHHQMLWKRTISPAAYLPPGAAMKSSWAWWSCNSRQWQNRTKVSCTFFTSPIESRGSRLYFTFKCWCLMCPTFWWRSRSRQSLLMCWLELSRCSAVERCAFPLFMSIYTPQSHVTHILWMFGLHKPAFD